MPTTPGGPYGWGTLNPAAGAGAAAAPAAGTGGGLAVTGSESAVLAYAGAGLIAFGAVALGSRRKFFQGTLED
jgi:LPXTG-motif cell wall-anchored protein